MSDEADLVRLVAQLEANSTKLEKDFKKAESVINTFSQVIEGRTETLRKKVESDFALMSKGAKGVFEGGAIGAGVATGIAVVIDKALEAAKAIGDTARSAGISVEALQKLRFASSQTGGSFEIMDTALVTFNKTFGEFINTGAGKGANAFKNLGIDKMIKSGEIRNTEQALDAFLGKVREIPSEAQKAAYAANVFGKEAGPKMMGFIDAGAASIKRLEEQAVSLGIVLSEDTVRGATEAKDKLDALFSVVEAQGVSAIAKFAPQIASLTQSVIDSLPSLTAWVEHWAAWFGLIKQSPTAELQYQIDSVKSDIDDLNTRRSQTTGFMGFVNSISTGGIDESIDRLKRKLAGLQDDLSIQPVTITSGIKLGNYEAPLHVGSTEAERQAAVKAAEALAQTQRAALDKIGVEQAAANSTLVTAQDSSAAEMLKGLAGYHAAVLKSIHDERDAKFAVIDEEEKKEIDSLAKLKLSVADYAAYKKKVQDTAATKRQTVVVEGAAKEDQIDGTAIMRDTQVESAKQVQTYKDQTAALGLTIGAIATLTFYQNGLNKATADGVTLTAVQIAKLRDESEQVGAAAKAAEAAKMESQRNIQVTDELRTGLEDVGAAGLKGFKSMKDAAGQFLEQLAEMILRLYVMKPLVEGLLGPSGASGGGLVGGGINDLLGALGLGGNFGTGLGTPGFMPGSDPALQTIDGSGGFLDWLGGILGFADGGVMTSRGPMKLRTYSGGGIANSPQVAMYGEGSGPEAYVPLKSGAIPVSLRMPRAPNAQPRGATVVNAPVTVYQSLSGAISPEGVASIARSQAVAVGGQFAKQVRQQFPEMLRTTLRDKA